MRFPSSIKRDARLFLYQICVTVPLFVSMLPGCGGKSSVETGAVVVGLESNPTNLDPRLATDASSSRIIQLMYNGLFRKDLAGLLVPDLVEWWKQENATSYLFGLKRGVQFHDGSFLDADDVVFTFRSVMDPSTRSPLRGSFTMVLVFFMRLVNS